MAEMTEYYDMKDKMRRSAQDEQAMRMRPVPVSPEIEGAPGSMMPAPASESVIVSKRQVIDGPPVRRREGPGISAVVKGAGGYEYTALSDGTFKITKSPLESNVGKIVKPGMKGYDAIKAEVYGEKPPAPAAPRDELFPEAGFKGGVEMRSPLEETLGTDFEQEMYEVSGVPTRTRSVVGSRILEQADRPAPRPAPLVQPTSPRAMQQRIASSTNPTYQQMVGETQGPRIRATMGKDLTEAFAFMGQTPEAARANAEALLGVYEKAGDPTVLRAIQSIIAARAAR